MHITVTNLTKQFPVSLLDTIVSFGKVILGAANTISKFSGFITAVDNVSLEVREGERLGIIGRNGAGKTTLLSMIAGLADPTAGKIELQGRVTCIMSLGVGLREDLNGRENIYIDGAINGKTKAQIEKVINEVIAFSEIGDFIDRPIKTYSSGMKARLTFSMLIYLEPEILIIDEALSVGDIHFVRKSSEKIKEICQKGKIVIIVSHSMQTIRQMCSRCIWLDKGKLVKDGDPHDVVDEYYKFVQKEEEADFLRKFRSRIRSEVFRSGSEITKLEFFDYSGNKRHIFNLREEVKIKMAIRNDDPALEPDVKVSFTRADGIILARHSASEAGLRLGDRTSQGQFELEIDLGAVSFGKNLYDVKAELVSGKTNELLAVRHSILKIDNPDYLYENPVIFYPLEWKIEEVDKKILCQS